MKESRNFQIDTLRTIATFLVIAIHIYAPFLGNNVLTYNNASFWLSNFIDSFSRIAVPIFVMISGYFLLGKTESLNSFFNKRVNKILIPIIFWSFFYSIYNQFGGILKTKSINLELIFDGIIKGKPYYHLWYVFMLLGLYALTPLLNIVIKSIKYGRLKQLTIILLLIGFSINSFNFYYKVEPMFLLWPFSYVGYFLMGYFIKASKISFSNTTLIWIFLVSSLMTFILSFGTFFYFKSFYFYEYSSPFVIISSISFFKLFTQLKINENYFSKLSNYSFGVYLIHAFVLHVLITLIRIKLNFFNDPIFGWFIAVITFIISVLLIKVIQMTTYLKRIV